jgi:cytochrome c nitrite reductase small subunit
MKLRQILIVSLFVVGGVLVGLVFFTFDYAEGDSYFSDNPEACLNCHVMRDQYEGWSHSSHKTVATCNDCRTPHDTVGKYSSKAVNGWNHSVAFTFGDYPTNIQIKDFNADIVRANCIDCHSTVVSQMVTDPAHAETLDCLTCHSDVGH